ncbi:hypothetical protein OHW47_03325 [Acinetobacter baumannii]|nr:hypothetical protein [Acinetobacter baumannii]MDC5231635.1 hypothetical protein [Acinetobacter baumannii]MDC5363494.1 hypothetical protein [Acinetobacter baumannii]
MNKSWVFRTKKGKLGLVKQTNNIFTVYVEDGLFPKTTEWDWNEWVKHYAQGNTENLTIEAVSHYLKYKNFFEEIVELLEVESPGYFYPRIARENIDFNYISNDFKQDIRAYQNIQNSLDELFNYIEPSTINFSSFGHKIRELLILSCTEVEYLLLKMLVDNGYASKSMYKTCDYVKCKDILKLSSFEVELTQYPNIGNFKPFADWDKSNPTKSIPWYDAYNAVKHNRGDNIEKANMKHLLDSVAAIHILLESQYGNKIFTKWQSLTEDRSMFFTTKTPNWDLKDITIPELERGFNIKMNWHSSKKYFDDYPF